MPLISFRDNLDPDERRKEILWTAISFVVILAVWLGVVLVFGYPPLALGMSYDEVVLVIGLGVLLLCSILYLVGKEREQRYTNRQLLGELHSTVGRLDERVQHLNGLCSISADLSGSLSVGDTARFAVEGLKTCLGAEQAYLVLLDSQTGVLTYSRRSGDEAGRYQPASLPAEEVWPAPLWSIREEVTDLEAQVRSWNELPRVVCVQFDCKNGLTGLLAARRAETSRPFAKSDMSALITLSNMVAKSLESAHLHAELRENYLATVRSLVLSLDARDNYAATHGYRVAALATRIAEQLGLPDSALRDIEVFAPLHDVGKIGIKDEILLKSGSLSEQEKDVCRQHCLIGDRIIRPLKPGREALSLVRNHHESWDGRGYPDGLAGDSIPLLARIIKVADCFDALISERPYGAVLSEEEALAHFRLQSGISYDPSIVAALGEVLRGEAPRDEVSVGRGGVEEFVAAAARGDRAW